MAVSEFNAKARASRCVSDLDGELNTYTDDDGEDCVSATVFDTLERYIQSAFEAGGASRQAEVEEARANYRFMVERATHKLDGYRELGAQLAASEERAARERLGRWLAEEPQRTWHEVARSDGHRRVVLLNDCYDDEEDAVYWEGSGETIANRINAALDAAERSRT